MKVREGGVTVAAEVRVIHPGAKECRWFLEAGKGKEQIIPQIFQKEHSRRTGLLLICP